MKMISIFVVCVFFKVSSATEPQIYEKPEDQIQVESNTRVIRQPYQVKKFFRPPVYNYQQTIQQDPRQFRYAQQQRLDMQNILRKTKMIQNPEAPLRVSLQQNWKIIDPTIASSTIEEKYKLPEATKNSSIWNKLTQLSTKKPVISRKLNPSSYYDQLNEDNLKREDNKIQINPEFLKTKRSDYDLNALNALVGQNPNNQLQGLQRLLESPQKNFVLSLIKSPHPITEHTEDIPNPNTHPNIDTTSVSLESLQSQLDEAAKAHLAQALADAQKEAEAEVEAQHKAIAKAQEQVQKKILAQIALHNQQINGGALQQPLALALRQEIVPTPITLPLKPTAQNLDYHKSILQPITLSEGYKATPKPIVLTVRQKSIGNLYAPSHSHQNQNKEIVETQKFFGITKTQSGAQNQQSPNAYQQVILETQQKLKNNSGVKHVQDLVDDVSDHQYAARYAFGYKIRDVQKGNEFGHEEKRDGENAKGLYHVLLPDGRMQKVEYYADEGGYHAKVTYENMAHQ